MIHALVVAAVVVGGVNLETETEVVTTSERVARSARDYRISVYESYHNDRTNFDTRYNLGRRIGQAWVEAGQPEEFGDRIIEWFDLARDLTPAPTAPEWLGELEQEALENAERRNLLTSTPAEPTITQPVIIAPVEIQPAEVETPDQEEQPAAKETEPSVSANSLLKSLGNSIFRATINSGVEKDSKTFE